MCCHSGVESLKRDNLSSVHPKNPVVLDIRERNTIWTHTARGFRSGSVTVDSRCIVGIVSMPLGNMADAFGDALFSVFDDDTAASSKTTPTAPTTNAG